MAWNGTGTYIQVTPVSSGATAWTDAKAAGDVNITTSDHDYHDQDIANGITNCIAKDGQNSATANLPMGGFRHTGVGDGVANTDYASLGQLVASSPAVGSPLNASMAVASASKSGTFTAGQVIVAGTLAGRSWCVSNINAAINLNNTGAGGMDTGSSPVSGYVAIYVIYNSTSGAVALLATDASSAIQPEVYAGGNRPAGYNASSLVAVWPTDGSGRMVVGFLTGRTLQTANRQALNSSTQHAGLTSLSLSSVIPRNAKSISGTVSIATSSSGTLLAQLSGASYTDGFLFSPGSAVSMETAFPNLTLAAPVTMFYAATVSAGTMTFSINISGYTF